MWPRLIVLALTLAFLQGAAPPPQSPAAAQVAAVEQQRLDAMERGDFDLVAGILAEDVTVTSSAGVLLTRAEYLAGLRSGRRRPAQMKHEGVAIRVYGDSAIITGRSHGVLVVDNQRQPFDARYTHTYVRLDGRWRLAAMQTTDVR